MILLFLSIFINTLIGVVFNYFGKYEIDNLHAIVINYIVCVIVGSLMIGQFVISPDMLEQKWFLYAVVLGISFILTFTAMAKTVQIFGLTIASIFQKMSLLAPSLLAISYFSESATIMKASGISLAIISIIILSKKEDQEDMKHGLKEWFFPIVTFLGSCFIDSVLYLVNEKQIADSGDIKFLSTLFFFAGVTGFIWIIYRYFIDRKNIKLKSAVAGILLGIPNFFSIYLLLLVLADGLGGSVVFPINNVGILALSAIFGFFLFGEKFGRFKIAGLTLSILSIILISHG